MKNYKWKFMLPAGVIVAIGIMIAIPKEDTSADYIAADIFHANTANTNMVFQLYEDGPTGDYYYQTSGKHHDNKTVHQTIGLEFTKIRDEFVEANGWHPKDWKYPTSQIANQDVDPHEYVTYADGSLGRVSVVIARYDDPSGGVSSKTQVLDNGQELNTWIISYDALWERIQQVQPAWYEDAQTKISSGKEYYFGVDAIKTIINNYDDSLSSDLDECQRMNYYENATAWLATDPVTLLPTHSGINTLYTWLNWDRDSWISYIREYYNKYFRGNHNPVDTPEVEEPVIITGDKITLTKSEDPSGDSNIGKGTGTNQSQDAFSSPRVYTYNESSEFNVGVGIPTTESYNNHIDVTSWYGSVEVTKRGGEA